MALLLRESDVEQLLTMPTTLELVERVHREYSTGHAIDVPRERTRLPKAALHILQGAVPSAGRLRLQGLHLEPRGRALPRLRDSTQSAATSMRSWRRTASA